MTVMEFKTLHLIMHECGFVALDGRLIKKEDPEADDITVTLEMVLAFATGADHEPPLGFENVPQVQFETRKD